MGRISSYFGKRESLNGRTQHDGLDFPAPVGSPIYSNKELTVLQSKTETGYGNIVMARDNAGNIYKFAHLDSVPENIKPGAKIQPGEQIAWTGISGVEKDGKQTSTGAHLHYEVIYKGGKVNPVHYFFNDLTPEQYEQILDALPFTEYDFKFSYQI